MGERKGKSINRKGDVCSIALDSVILIPVFYASGRCMMSFVKFDTVLLLTF